MDDRDEWLAWRRAGIGASDIAGILGLSPWASPYSVWADKMGLVDDDATEAMEMGQIMEPAIDRLFFRRTGLHVVGQQQRCQHPELPWARATIDGRVVESPEWDGDPLTALGNHEAKTTSDSVAKWADEIPIQYLCQIQWQMFVTGAMHTWVSCLHASWGLKYRVYEVARDDEDIAFIVHRVTRFYEQHIRTGVPPEVDSHSATSDALGHLTADPGQAIDLADPLRRTVNDLRDLKAQAKRLDEQITLRENELKAALGEATEAMVDGVLVASWRPVSRASLDAKALRANHPDIAALYTSTTTSRRFVLAAPKKEKP